MKGWVRSDSAELLLLYSYCWHFILYTVRNEVGVVSSSLYSRWHHIYCERDEWGVIYYTLWGMRLEWFQAAWWQSDSEDRSVEWLIEPAGVWSFRSRAAAEVLMLEQRLPDKWQDGMGLDTSSSCVLRVTWVVVLLWNGKKKWKGLLIEARGSTAKVIWKVRLETILLHNINQSINSCCWHKVVRGMMSEVE